VQNEIDPRLWVEAAIAVTSTAAAAGLLGHCDAADETIWLTHADWMEVGDDVEDPPFYLLLNERTEPGVDADWTWLASFTGAWPGRATMGFFVGDDRLKSNAVWKKQLRANQAIVDSLVTRGFRYDGASGELYVPFLVDGETLAKAFEQDEFGTALEPLAQAVMVVSNAHSELTNLYRLSAI
jgi:hypothetical protein